MFDLKNMDVFCVNRLIEDEPKVAKVSRARSIGYFVSGKGNGFWWNPVDCNGVMGTVNLIVSRNMNLDSPAQNSALIRGVTGMKKAVRRVRPASKLLPTAN